MIATGRCDIFCASAMLAAFPAAVVARRRKAQPDANLKGPQDDKLIVLLRTAGVSQQSFGRFF